MESLSLRSDPHIVRPFNPSFSTSNPSLFVKPIKVVVSYGKEFNFKHPLTTSIGPSKFATTLREQTPTRQINLKHIENKNSSVEHAPTCCQRPFMKLVTVPENEYSRFVIMGAVSVGILVLLAGMDDQKALALGPEGPLVEEFWDNVRRYALYALTVSTGAIYTIVQPIIELLKNPISAILVLAILGGSIYIVSQVLSAMVGVTDFTYDYGY